jgi:hypothetical protein
MSNPPYAKEDYGPRIGDEDVSTRPSDPPDKAQPSLISSFARPSPEQVFDIYYEREMSVTTTIYSSALHHPTLNYPIACDGFPITGPCRNGCPPYVVRSQNGFRLSFLSQNRLRKPWAKVPFWC